MKPEEILETKKERKSSKSSKITAQGEGRIKEMTGLIAAVRKRNGGSEVPLKENWKKLVLDCGFQEGSS